MRTSLREQVREQFGERCGYCGVREDEAGARLTIDHFRPVSQGGTDEIGNLIYCCHACNEFKGDYWSEEEDHQLLHPANDNLTIHFVERTDYQLVARTERGANHIVTLRLNRPELVAARRRRAAIAHREEYLANLQERLERMETQVRLLSENMAQLTGGITVTPDD